MLNRRGLLTGLMAVPFFPAEGIPESLVFPVKIAGSGGTGAMIAIQIENGKIVSARVVASGSGYDDPLGATS